MSTTTETIDTSAIFLDVRVCAALTDAICKHYQGLEVDPEEAALANVATDLAERIDDFIQNLPVGTETSRLGDMSGPLAASLQAAHEASQQAVKVDDEDAMGSLVTRASWLQIQARDLAERLMEALSVKAQGGVA